MEDQFLPRPKRGGMVSVFALAGLVVCLAGLVGCGWFPWGTCSPDSLCQELLNCISLPGLDEEAILPECTTAAQIVRFLDPDCYACLCQNPCTADTACDSACQELLSMLGLELPILP